MHRIQKQFAGAQCVTDKDVEKSMGHIMKGHKCHIEELIFYPVGSGESLRILSNGISHAGIWQRTFQWEETARVKTLKLECPWCLHGQARKPVWPEYEGYSTTWWGQRSRQGTDGALVRTLDFILSPLSIGMTWYNLGFKVSLWLPCCKGTGVEARK